MAHPLGFLDALAAAAQAPADGPSPLVAVLRKIHQDKAATPPPAPDAPKPAIRRMLAERDQGLRVWEQAVDGVAEAARARQAQQPEAVGAALLEVQLLMLKHPVAGQALFRALVSEGRRFAQTPEGARWQAALADTRLARRGRVLWEVLGMGVFQEQSETFLPTRLLEALVQATDADRVEPLLASLFPAGPRSVDDLPDAG